MSGGLMSHDFQVNDCVCGTNPVLIWHYMKGVANKIHYFMKCENCRIRTVDRKTPEGAASAWNIGQYQK